MDRKVSVIIIGADSTLDVAGCAESFRKQQSTSVELIFCDGERCETVLDQVSGEFLLFAKGDEIADRGLLKAAVKCAEESGAEIVLLPEWQFDHENGSVSKAMVYEPCMEMKLFRKEYISNNWGYLLQSNIKYSKYIGLSLLAGTANIVEMPLGLLYSRIGKKINGNEILQNYTLLYDDLCARNKWNETKRRFLNWFLTDMFLWLDGRYITCDVKAVLKKIKMQLLIKLGDLDYKHEYYTSVYSRRGAFWINGIDAGEGFQTRHTIDYESIAIQQIKGSHCDKTPLISVIMPVFNVEKYIADALNSLENQTFTEFEIICVDDCSTDHSLDILLQYANNNPYISIYHQKNCGQSVARNRGLNYARGEYIYFMDSDDILQETALEMLYNRCVKYDLDVVYFDGEVFSDLPENDFTEKQFENYYNRVGVYPKTVYKGLELMQEMWRNDEYRVTPCLQLIKKRYIVSHGLYFPQGIIHEDNAFNFLCMAQAERAGYYGIQLYRRRLRNDSTITKKSTFENVYGYLRCYINILHWLQHNDLPDQYYQTVHELLDSLIHSAKYHYTIIEGSERLIVNYLQLSEWIFCQKLIVEETS